VLRWKSSVKGADMLEITLCDENGAPIVCTICGVNQPKEVQFGILCRACISNENMKWRMFRETQTTTPVYESAFGEVEK